MFSGKSQNRAFMRKVFKANDEVDELKTGVEDLKKFVKKQAKKIVKEIESEKKKVKKDVKKCLKNAPMDEKEKETVWLIIDEIEQFRTEIDKLKKKYKKRKEIEKMVKEYKSSINEVLGNMLDKQEKDFKVKLQENEQQSKVEDIKGKQELKSYFFKQGKLMKSWKRRWFHFKKDLKFAYYETRRSMSAIDEVDCRDNFKVTVDKEVRDDFCLKIRTSNRIYKLLLGNEEQLNKWKRNFRIWHKLNKKKNEEKKKEFRSLNDMLKSNL